MASIFKRKSPSGSRYYVLAEWVNGKRRQGWTEQAIAEEVGIPQRTISYWLVMDFSNNPTMGNIANHPRVSKNPIRANVAKSLGFRSFLGKLNE